MITHDMGFVAEMADNVLVMKSGHTEEYGHVSQIFAKPNVAYTRTLLEAVPRLDCISERDAIAPNTLLSATSITRTFKTRGTMFLHDQGHVALDGVSLDPRRTVGSTIAEPLIIQPQGTNAERNMRVSMPLEKVCLSADIAHRYPHEFSGGQRQRVAIASAIAANPTLVVADEPTSALDVSIKARVLNLLDALKRSEDLTMLFISHDLAVVRQIADRVSVMRNGRILALGNTASFFAAPKHPYTRALIDVASILDLTCKRGRRPTLQGTYPVGPLKDVAPGHWVTV